MHKHGVKAWFLGSGSGAFPYATVIDAVNAGYSGINMKNPPLRDDFVTVSVIIFARLDLPLNRRPHSSPSI